MSRVFDLLVLFQTDLEKFGQDFLNTTGFEGSTDQIKIQKPNQIAYCKVTFLLDLKCDQYYNVLIWVPVFLLGKLDNEE